MDEIRISAAGRCHGHRPSEVGGKAVSGGFEGMLTEAIGKVSEIQNNAENAIRELSRGGDVTHAVIEMEKADMAFQVMVEVRNRLLSAYEEIMRMQV